MTRNDEINQQGATRAALLDAAEKLFTKKGYAAVSTREIAEVAGVNLASIQYHFGSKAKLFLETINCMMKDGSCVQNAVSIELVAASKNEAAIKICDFIFNFLNYLLKPKDKNACRLIFREIFSESTEEPELHEALVTNFSDHFCGPVSNALASLVKIIDNDLSEYQSKQSARSIMGQCVYYASHHHFLQRMDNLDFSQDEQIKDTAIHVSTFTLKALSCDPLFISKILKEVFEDK